MKPRVHLVRQVIPLPPLEPQIQLSLKFNIAPKVKVNIHEESLFAFEFFTFRNVEMIDEMRSFLKFSSEKQTLLDIGALFGIFSLAFTAGRPDKKAFAVEPSPAPYNILNRNISLNPKLKIKSYPSAMGSKNGKLKMYYDWMHLVSLPKSNRTKEFTEVNVLKLDDFLKNENIIPDVIKLDTEGSEFDIIQGGKKFLKKHRPLIFLETHTQLLNELGISITKLVDLIHSLGYKIYDLEGNLINDSKKLLASIPNYRVILSHKSLI